MKARTRSGSDRKSEREIRGEALADQPRNRSGLGRWSFQRIGNPPPASCQPFDVWQFWTGGLVK